MSTTGTDSWLNALTPKRQTACRPTNYALRAPALPCESTSIAAAIQERERSVACRQSARFVVIPDRNHQQSCAGFAKPGSELGRANLVFTRHVKIHSVRRPGCQSRRRALCSTSPTRQGADRCRHAGTNFRPERQNRRAAGGRAAQPARSKAGGRGASFRSRFLA